MTYTKAQLLEAADVLDKAYDVILERGWWPGNNFCNHGNHESRCISAAILEAMGLPLSENYPESSLLGGRAPTWMFQLVIDKDIRFIWNDTWGRTEDEVFDRLRSVAKSLREEASL